MSKQTTRNMERTWYSAVGMRVITATVQAWYKVCYVVVC